MNVYCFDEITNHYLIGLMLVAANSENEAIDFATEFGFIDESYGFVPKCYIVSEFTANINAPKIIKQVLYIK